MLSGNEIREKYLEFFESKSHKVYESASLVPDDPTMLLTIAGMVPFKPFFMGKKVPPHNRLASCQKCIRTNDLENVGRTARHHTFFEMLGNFAFGDYFKEEAIIWAWEFMTKVIKLPVDKLWISVFEEDDESAEIWKEKAGVSPDRIVRLGEEDNFWSAGPTGSCGPCSEIYVDLGEEMGCGSPDCGVGCECDRYVEVWNLVFTEFNRLEDGSLIPLPKKNIDTGMGLERITSVVQGVTSNFDTDLIQPIIKKISKITEVKYNADVKSDFSIRVIADHIRAITMLISDGVLPSNDGRGYVLRRILRRAARHGRLLGYKGLFLYNLVDTVIDIMGDVYAEAKKQTEHIKKVIKREEEKFEYTLDQGIQMASDEIKKAKEAGKSKLESEIVFKLYDTYGFPYELTEEICEENDIFISFDEFKEKMEEQKERARNSREVIKEKIEDSFIADFHKEYGGTEFIGYENNSATSKVLHIKEIDSENIDVIFDKSVFYAESGGQVADTGKIESEEFKGKITDVQKRKDIFIHNIKITEGSLNIGDEVTQKVNVERRKSISRNHTATHILQAALKEVLGDHVNQAGSLVTEERLRFDFSHYEALKNEEIEEIERIVNIKILANMGINSAEMDIEKAKEMGAMALFGDKYGSNVRVINVSDYSVELCGGIHVGMTGEIGLFNIIDETGIAAGIRRIEARTGISSLNFVNKLEREVEDIAETLKVDKEHVLDKSKQAVDHIKELSKEVEKLQAKLASLEINEVIENPEIINGVSVVIKSFVDQDPKSLRGIVDKARDTLKSCVVVLGTVTNGKGIFIAGVTKDLIEKGVKAGDIVREVAQYAGGKGGGRPDFAQAGAKDISKVKEAVEFAKKFLGDKL